MPSEAISLALAASIYPPAVAAVIALGRGSEVRLRVVLFVCAALLTVFATGSLMLLLFEELGATSSQTRSIASGLYILGGLLLLGLAWRLRHPGAPKPKQEEQGPARTERYLESRRLVLALGFILYVVPSPIYVGAVKAISDTQASTSQQLAYLAVTVLIMLWLIEIPMLMLLAFPHRGAAVLESINDWFARNGRMVAVLAAAGAGVYLIAVGLVEVL